MQFEDDFIVTLLNQMGKIMMRFRFYFEPSFRFYLFGLSDCTVTVTTVTVTVDETTPGPCNA